jgi:hypothetical protein
MYKCIEDFTSLDTGKTYRRGYEITYPEFEDLSSEDQAYFVDEDIEKFELSDD